MAPTRTGNGLIKTLQEMADDDVCRAIGQYRTNGFEVDQRFLDFEGVQKHMEDACLPETTFIPRDRERANIIAKEISNIEDKRKSAKSCSWGSLGLRARWDVCISYCRHNLP